MLITHTPPRHSSNGRVAASVNQDATLAAVPVRASQSRTFGPAQPVLATPAAVTFAGAVVAAFVGVFQVTAAANG